MNNAITKKKVTLEVLEKLMECLDTEENLVNTKIVWFKTDEPRLDEDGNPKKREDGSIIYKEDYKYEQVPETDLTEEEKLKLKAIDELRKQLEKLV